MTVTQNELNEIVRLHKLWLIGGPNGRRADLSSADLSSADLSSADLRYADLSSADLRYANLRYANLDYSCRWLSCKTNSVKVCAKIAAQLAAHFCVLDCDDPAYRKARKAILAFAKTSHRAVDLGLKKEASNV